jgi:hypothetical protein
MMNRLLLGLAIAQSAWACTLTITSPTNAQTVSGTFWNWTVTASSCPSLAAVAWSVDNQPPYFSLSAPWTFNADSAWYFNGPHEIIVKAYDKTGNAKAGTGLIATSAAIDFSISNTVFAPNSGSGVTITPGTPFGSTWSGTVNLGATLSGATSPQQTWYIDGVPVTGPALDTTKFDNGPRIVAYEAIDGTAGWMGTGGFANVCGSTPVLVNGALAEFARQVNFSNGATPMETRANAREIFLSIGQTFTLVPTVYNTDETPASSGTNAFISSNPSAATINANTGLITAVANGSTQVTGMVAAFSGSDLHTDSFNGQYVYSSSHNFSASDVGGGKCLLISTTTGGWIPGCIPIVGFTSSPNELLLQNYSAATGLSGGSWAIGSLAARTAWVFVNPSPVMPHFGTDGSLLTSYDPTKSIFLGALFQSGGSCTDDFAYPACYADIAAAGFNTIETAITPVDIDDAGSSQTVFQAAQTAYVTQQIANIAPYPTLHYHLIGDQLVRDIELGTTSDVWAGCCGPLSSGPTPAVQFAAQSWQPSVTGSRPVIGADIADEFNSSPGWGNPNFAVGVPVEFGNYGFSSVVCTTSPSICTFNWTGWSLTYLQQFLIHGASHTAMNNVAPATYTATSVNANSFTIPNPGVGAITLNAGNDSGLILEPLGFSWFNGNSSYITQGAFTQYLAWFNSTTPPLEVTYADAAGTTNASILSHENPSVTNPISNFATIYYTSGGGTINYLATQSNINSIISSVGDNTRAKWGFYSPNVPMLLKGEATAQDYGFSGNPVGITSISSSGSVTFSAPHTVTTLYGGVSRLSILGASAVNGNFYFATIDDSTHAHISYAASTFTATGAGGTATFSDGSTVGITSIQATGVNSFHGTGQDPTSIDGDPVTFASCNTSSGTLLSKRGLTFTVTTSGFTDFTFIYLAENLNNCAANQYQRQVVTTASTGGTASVIPDNMYQKGRNRDFSYYGSPAWELAVAIEALHARAAGLRWYTMSLPAQRYSSTYGYLGANGQTNMTYFNDTCNQEVQMSIYPDKSQDETLQPPIASSILPFQALGVFTEMANNRLLKYYTQPSVNSPDYGRLFEASAHCGSTGCILIVSNMSNGTLTRTIPLSAYTQAGQNFLRYDVEWNGVDTTVLTSGTTSDAVTFDPAQTSIYLFPVNFSTEYTTPAVPFNLSAFAGATSVAINYNHSPALLNQRIKAVTATSSPASLPTDTKIGTVYYQIAYLDSSNNLLGQSAVQTLAGSAAPIPAPSRRSMFAQTEPPAPSHLPGLFSIF